MPEERKMGTVAKITVVAALALVILLFGGIGLRAYNNSFEAKEMIGEARAEEIAVSDAGVKKEDVERMSFRTEYDDGRTIYELDFYTKDKEYEYDIDARSGKIIKRESDLRRFAGQ